MAVLSRPSSGREPLAFSVATAAELPGVHAELIGAGVLPGEAAQALLYAPIWEGTEGRFGIRGVHASHAVAVMSDRFLISRDEHLPSSSPVLTVIPFARVVSIEIGSALVLGWFVVRYVEGPHVAQAVILHGAMRGQEHFLRAVREFRRVFSASGAEAGSPGFDDDVPGDMAVHVRAVMLDGERVQAGTFSHELWGRATRGRRTMPRAVEPATFFCVTDRGLILCQAEQPVWPGMLCFGVNVVCIPIGVSFAMDRVTRRSHDATYDAITLRLLGCGASHSLTVPLHGVPGDYISRLVRVLEDRGDGRG